MPYNPNLKCQALSKCEASKFKPNKPTLLISIQDGDKSHLPFKNRTNHITRSRYKDVLFCYFDDIDLIRLNCEFNSPFLFSQSDAKIIIKFLNNHFANPENFEQIIVHCQAGISRSQAGISRSQAIANFIAKYYYKDENLLNEMKKSAPLPDGNLFIYSILEKEFLKGLD